jgi:hypothetical protein
MQIIAETKAISDEYELNIRATLFQGTMHPGYEQQLKNLQR